MSTSVSAADYGLGGWKVIIVAVLLIVMQLIMVAGRFVSRSLQKASLALDDYVLAVSAVVTVALCALAVAFPRIAGIEANAVSLKAPISTESEEQTIDRTFMTWMIVYGLSIAFSKCAILLLYIRVFTTCKRTFTVSACLVGFVIVGTAIANTFVAIFQCHPQSFAWDKSIAEGTCIDTIRWTRYIAIPNVVTGAVMLVMPLPIVWKLNVNVSAKIALTATFLHGIIGFIASCARLSILFSTDVSQLSNNTSLVWTIWTINEPANYIIAACLPTLRPLFIRIFPSSFFILSHRRPSKPYSSSALKISWPKGSLTPKFHLETKRFQSTAQMTGPWNSCESTWEADGYWSDIEGRGTEMRNDQRVSSLGISTPSAEKKKKEPVERIREVDETEDM